MNYKIEHLNSSTEIKNATFDVVGVDVVLVDENGKRFGIQLSIEDLGIDDKVLRELEKFKV